MSIPSIVTRLQKIHEGLMTISSLQRLKDMSGKRTKPCTCAHHRSPSRSRCPRKCSSHGNRDKSLHCPCRERPKPCLCSRTSDDRSMIESSKRSEADEDFKLDSDFPTRPDRQIEVVDKNETTNLADRVGQKVPAGIASNDRIARTAARFDPGNGDGKPDAVTDSKSIIESSKRSEADEDFKLDSDFPTRPDRQIEDVDKDETTNLADRVGQKVPAGIALKDRIARTATRFKPGNGDGKPNAVTDSKSIIESSKRSEADEDKLDSDFPTRPDRQIEVVDKDETTNLADRVGQKVPAGIAIKDRIARTATRFKPGNRDGKPDAVTDSNRNAVASQTVDTVDRLKASDIDRANDDGKDVEQMYKELLAEKIRNRELEEKLEKTNCSLQCLKIEGEEQAACLKDALEKAKIQAELATRSRNLAVDIAKQSRNQTDLVKASRDEVLSQINVVKRDNSKLQCECDELRSKLREMSESEEKKCAEVDDKVNRIKCAVKEKEMALACKKSELEETVAELTRLVKEQKKRICDLTSICTKQRSALQEHENCIAAKIAQLSEGENRIQSMNCRCGSMDDEIEYLKCCLNEQAEARDKLQKAFDERQDNCNCELQIKDKIIADQVETIKKLKKLLQDSEKMAHQAAREFESLRDELHCLKQSNKSLRFALDEAEAQMSDGCEIECCERCTTLEAQLRGLSQQKQKALVAAKCAAEKLCETTMNYQRQLDCEKQQHCFVVDLLQRKETEIELLKHEIRHIKECGGRRLSHYNHQ